MEVNREERKKRRKERKENRSNNEEVPESDERGENIESRIKYEEDPEPEQRKKHKNSRTECEDVLEPKQRKKHKKNRTEDPEPDERKKKHKECRKNSEVYADEKKKRKDSKNNLGEEDPESDEDPNDRITIRTNQYVEWSDDVWIVNLPYGRAAHGDFSGVKFMLCKSTSQDIEKRRDRILFAQMDGMNYIAHSDLRKYAVGSITKDRILLLKFARTYNLRPYHQDEEDVEEEGEAEEEELTKQQKADRFVEEFGSSKAKRYVASRKRNEVKGDALEAAIGSAVSDVLLTLKPDPDASSSANDMMPVCHRNAELVEDVYLLSDLILDPEMTALSNVSSEFFESTREQVIEWRKESKYSCHILDRLEYLTHDEKLRNHKASCLCYMQYLITLFQMKVNEIRRLHTMPMTMPEIIKQNLLEKFTVIAADNAGKTVRCMPKRHKDALVSHILVLSLLLDDLHSNCSSLKRDLQLTDTSLRAQVGALGCRLKIDKKDAVTSEDFVYTIFLQLPLSFKLESSRKRKRD